MQGVELEAVTSIRVWGSSSGGGSRGNGENKQERGGPWRRGLSGRVGPGTLCLGPAAGATGVVTGVRMRQESKPGPQSQRGPGMWSLKPEWGAHRDECPAFQEFTLGTSLTHTDLVRNPDLSFCLNPNFLSP